MRYFEDLVVGQEVAFEEEYHVTEDEIIEVATKWDPQPFHVDPVAARKSIFKGLVASSVHVFSIAISFGHRNMCDRDRKIAAVTALGFNNLQWHTPVRPKDVLKASHRVTEARESRSKPGFGVATVANKIVNQDKKTVFTWDCSFLVPKKSNPSG